MLFHVWFSRYIYNMMMYLYAGISPQHSSGRETWRRWREREREAEAEAEAAAAAEAEAVLCVWTCTHMVYHGIPWYTYIHVCMWVPVYKYIYIYVCIYICVNIYIYKCVCMYICIYDNKWHHIYNHGQTTSTRAPQELGLKRRRCGVEFRSRPRGQS